MVDQETAVGLCLKHGAFLLMVEWGSIGCSDGVIIVIVRRRRRLPVLPYEAIGAVIGEGPAVVSK